jgi:hypothetical protein
MEKERMRCLALVLVLGVVTLFAAAQGAEKAKFEVANVKPAEKRGFLSFSPSGQWSNSGTTVKALLAAAYRLRVDQIRGAPAWTDNEYWAIHRIAAADVAIITGRSL